MFESELDLDSFDKKIKKHGTIGEGFNILLVPKSLKGVLHKKYPEFWMCIVPCLINGKVLYFEE